MPHNHTHKKKNLRNHHPAGAKSRLCNFFSFGRIIYKNADFLMYKYTKIICQCLCACGFLSLVSIPMINGVFSKQNPRRRKKKHAKVLLWCWSYEYANFFLSFEVGIEKTPIFICLTAHRNSHFINTRHKMILADFVQCVNQFIIKCVQS